MKNRRLWAFIALFAFALLCDHLCGWSTRLANPTSLPLLRHFLQENLALALGLYMFLTCLGCVLLALPGVTFALAAGLLFGPAIGTIACWLAVTIGACLSFLAGRYFLKDAIKPHLQKNPVLNRLLFEDAAKGDFFLLAVTRLIPIFPYNLQNFAYGITDIAFAPYALYSAIFMLPGTAAYTLGAAGLAQPEKRLAYLSGAVVLLVLVLGAARVLQRKAVKP